MLKRLREPAEGDAMHGGTILLFFTLGCAALALWALARYPQLGPRRPLALIVAVVALVVGMRLAGPVFDAVAGLGQFGTGLALLAVVLPTLTGAFWVSGCVLRALAGSPGLRR
jgi:hypothetical protein